MTLSLLISAALLLFAVAGMLALWAMGEEQP